VCLQGGEQGITELVLKVLTDSFVWGTISNTLNIVGRSLIEARGPEAAFSKWRTEIQEVTVSEFKFFPIWNAVNFHLIPHQWRVSFGAFGLPPHNHPSPPPSNLSPPPPSSNPSFWFLLCLPAPCKPATGARKLS